MANRKDVYETLLGLIDQLNSGRLTAISIGSVDEAFKCSHVEIYLNLKDGHRAIPVVALLMLASHLDHLRDTGEFSDLPNASDFFNRQRPS